MDKLILAFASLPGLTDLDESQRDASIQHLCTQLLPCPQECSFNLAIEDATYPGGDAPLFKAVMTLAWPQPLSRPAEQLRTALAWSNSLGAEDKELNPQVWGVNNFVPWRGDPVSDDPARNDLRAVQVRKIPGFKLMVLSYGKTGIGRPDFEAKYRNEHTPKVRHHCPGIWTYRQNFVQQQLHGKPLDPDAIAEMNFRSREDFTQRFYATPESRAVILEGAATFMDNSRAQWFPCTETLWRFP